MSFVMGWGKSVIVASTVMARYMIETFKVRPDKIRIIPRGVDPVKFKFKKPSISSVVIENVFSISFKSLALKKDALNHYLRGEANEKLGNSQAAINDHQMAVRLNSRYIDPRLALAGIYMEGDRLTDAINECNTILSLDNKNTQAYLLRSKVYVKQLNMPDAINDISRILLIEPENADMFFLRGQYYQMFNQNINAITDFTKAISLRPDDPEIFMARAKSYEEILDYKSAEKDYKKITQLTENNAMVKRLK